MNPALQLLGLLAVSVPTIVTVWVLVVVVVIRREIKTLRAELSRSGSNPDVSAGAAAPPD